MILEDYEVFIQSYNLKSTDNDVLTEIDNSYSDPVVLWPTIVFIRVAQL